MAAVIVTTLRNEVYIGVKALDTSQEMLTIHDALYLRNPVMNNYDMELCENPEVLMADEARFISNKIAIPILNLLRIIEIKDSQLEQIQHLYWKKRNAGLYDEE